MLLKSISHWLYCRIGEHLLFMEMTGNMQKTYQIIIDFIGTEGEQLKIIKKIENLSNSIKKYDSFMEKNKIQKSNLNKYRKVYLQWLDVFKAILFLHNEEPENAKLFAERAKKEYGAFPFLVSKTLNQVLDLRFHINKEKISNTDFEEIEQSNLHLIEEIEQSKLNSIIKSFLISILLFENAYLCYHIFSIIYVDNYFQEIEKTPYGSHITKDSVRKKNNIFSKIYKKDFLDYAIKKLPDFYVADFELIDFTESIKNK